MADDAERPEAVEEGTVDGGDRGEIVRASSSDVEDDVQPKLQIPSTTAPTASQLA